MAWSQLTGTGKSSFQVLESVMDHLFALALLAYLVFRRPLAGVVVGILEGIWLLWPVYGLPEVVSLNAHVTLGLVCLFSWRSDDLFHSAGLCAGGAILLGIIYFLRPMAGGASSVPAGFMIGELAALVWIGGQVLFQTRWSGSAEETPKAFLRISQLNSPLAHGRRDG